MAVMRILLFYIAWLASMTDLISSFRISRKLIRLLPKYLLALDPIQASASILAVSGVAIPTSIIVDEFLQSNNARISKIANTKITDGLGDVYAYIALPKNVMESTKKYPVVVVVHQFFGLRPRDTELCDELASLGYVAVAPDCYQGNTTSLIPRAISLVSGAAYKDDWSLPLRDFRRVMQYLIDQPFVDSTQIAVSGFCFGGGVALRYADTYPDGIKACGIFYGKPISIINKLNCEVYGVYGDKDRQFGPIMVNEFKSKLVEKRIQAEFRLYKNQAHAFIEDLNCIERGGDAGDAWDGWLACLQRALR